MILGERKASNECLLNIFLFCLQQAGSKPQHMFMCLPSFLPLGFVKVAVQLPDIQDVPLSKPCLEREGGGERLVSL